MTASRMIVLRRPQPSESRPANIAPNAAAKTSELVATPSVKGVRPSSAAMGRSAPLMTPVSYPKSSPPNVAIRATTPSRFLCGPFVRAGSFPASGWVWADISDSFVVRGRAGVMLGPTSSYSRIQVFLGRAFTQPNNVMSKGQNSPQQSFRMPGQGHFHDMNTIHLMPIGLHYLSAQLNKHGTQP